MLIPTDDFLQQPQVALTLARELLKLGSRMISSGNTIFCRPARENENTEKGQARVLFKIMKTKYFMDLNIINTCHITPAFSCKNEQDQVSQLSRKTQLRLLKNPFWYVWKFDRTQ